MPQFSRGEQMSTETEMFNSVVGKRIADLRKQQGLTQAELASRLSRRRTQAWMSNLESGLHNVNASDLFEIAAILESTVGDLSHTLSHPTSSKILLRDTLAELDARLPLEIPVYLQHDLGKPDPDPVDYHYSSTALGGAMGKRGYPPLQPGSLCVMIAERYYSSPKLDPTDLLTYNRIFPPVPDPDMRITDRVLVKLDEPHAGLSVHPGLIRPSGEVEMTLSGHQTTLFGEGTFEILGVLVLRRTMYRLSSTRRWIQSRFGIEKDERLAYYDVRQAEILSRIALDR